jgi:hypothetical protein
LRPQQPLPPHPTSSCIDYGCINYGCIDVELHRLRLHFNDVLLPPPVTRWRKTNDGGTNGS